LDGCHGSRESLVRKKVVQPDLPCGASDNDTGLPEIPSQCINDLVFDIGGVTMAGVQRVQI
jgi:hypothetical protein